MTDNQIIQGSGESFDAVYEQLSRKLWLFACSIVRNEAEAEDIVADAFVKLLVKKIKFKDIDHITAFLLNVVKNTSIDHLRKHQKKLEIEHLLMASGAINENEIERNFYRAEVIAKLYARINELPERTKQVFILSHLEGRSRSEVAQLLNITENTVRNTNQAAMKVLKLAFGEEELVIILLLTFKTLTNN